MRDLSHVDLGDFACAPQNAFSVSVDHREHLCLRVEPPKFVCCRVGVVAVLAGMAAVIAQLC